MIPSSSSGNRRITATSFRSICSGAHSAMVTESLYKFQENALPVDEIEALQQLLRTQPGLRRELEENFEQKLQERRSFLMAHPEINRQVEERADRIVEQLLNMDAEDQPSDSDSDISEAEEVSSYEPSHSGNDVSDSTSWTSDLKSSVNSVDTSSSVVSVDTSSSQEQQK